MIILPPRPESPLPGIPLAAQPEKIAMSPMIPIPVKWMSRHGLSLYAGLVALSFVGWVVFQRDGIPAGAEVDPALVAAAGEFFAQSQIALAALILFAWLGWRRLGPLAAPVVSIFAASLAIESFGVAWGVPFGSYIYAPALGFQLPGGVPWTIPLSWAATTTAFYLLVSAACPEPASRIRRVATTSLLLLAWDLSLDPAMSTINGFWVWASPGGWYGVPFTNLLGWYLSGLLFAAILEFGAAHRQAAAADKKWLATYLALVAALPVAMLVVEGMWGAAIASAALTAATLASLRRRDPRRRGDTRAPDGEGENLDYLGKHSKTFRFASSFLSNDAQRLVAGVYGWCRVTDDLVDEVEHMEPEQVRVRLDAWETLSRRAYGGGETGIPLLDGLFGEMRAKNVPFDHAQELIEGMRMDLEPRRYRDEAELRTYSHRVASTIGTWLVRSAGIDNPWVLKRAEALGHAMQLTNILRDVGDDHKLGRIYIPLEDLERAGLAAEDLAGYADGSRPIDARWKSLVETLMERADRDYALAYEGMSSLPRSFRFGVAVAASVYQGIHGAIRANGYDNFRHRAVVEPLGKCALAIRGLWRLRRAHPARQRAAALSLRNIG